MQLKYGLEDHPGFAENLIYGLQWLAVALPAIIILGKVLGGLEEPLLAKYCICRNCSR